MKTLLDEALEIDLKIGNIYIVQKYDYNHNVWELFCIDVIRDIVGRQILTTTIYYESKDIVKKLNMHLDDYIKFLKNDTDGIRPFEAPPLEEIFNED